jgi:hypothetical protein
VSCIRYITEGREGKRDRGEGAGCEERIRVIKRVTGGKRGGGDVEEDWLKIHSPLPSPTNITLTLKQQHTDTHMYRIAVLTIGFS